MHKLLHNNEIFEDRSTPQKEEKCHGLKWDEAHYHQRNNGPYIKEPKEIVSKGTPLEQQPFICMWSMHINGAIIKNKIEYTYC